MKKLDIKPIKQQGNDNCWAACLSMALGTFGVHKTEKELVAMFGDGGRGADWNQINDELSGKIPNLESDFRNEAYTGKPGDLTFDEIKDAIDKGRPIMVGVYDFHGLQAHAILIFGYDDQNQTVLIADPYQLDYQPKLESIRSYKLEELKGHWAESLIIKKK